MVWFDVWVPLQAVLAIPQSNQEEGKDGGVYRYELAELYDAQQLGREMGLDEPHCECGISRIRFVPDDDNIVMSIDVSMLMAVEKWLTLIRDAAGMYSNEWFEAICKKSS